MAQLGDGGFLSSDFELLQQVGRLSVQQVGRRRTASRLSKSCRGHFLMLSAWNHCRPPPFDEEYSKRKRALVLLI